MGSINPMMLVFNLGTMVVFILGMAFLWFRIQRQLKSFSITTHAPISHINKLRELTSRLDKPPEPEQSVNDTALQSLLQMIPHAVYIATQDKKFAYTKNFEKFGYAAEELVGVEYASIIEREPYTDMASHQISPLTETSSVNAGEIRDAKIKAKNGSFVSAKIISVLIPVRNGEEKTVGYLGIVKVRR
jgi:hypothetical protein